MAAVSPAMAAFFSSSHANLREMSRLSERMSDACDALGEAAIPAAPSVSRSSDAPTTAPPSRGAKRPSESADGAPVLKCARRGTAPSSKYIGVSWSKSRSKWSASYKLSGRKVAVGLFAVEEDAARAYYAALNQVATAGEEFIAAQLTEVRRVKLEDA
ncbi:hypothetical protein M885DRAFT_517924 [Pelagophyceae sp. CCMP2097]|nr:hypothetical protein M885DRAFT_517924 [Pelagophyceae sp. CCMP2097]